MRKKPNIYKLRPLFNIDVDNKDIVTTPDLIAERIVAFLAPKGICLDPCRGNGAFYKYLPTGKQYCEIKEGRDFFNYEKTVDWIIGNPPYSIFESFLEKSFKLADNVSYLVPTNKVFQRQLIMEMISNYGGIKSLIVFGSGAEVGFPFGFSVGNFHFKKNYSGKCKLILGKKQLNEMV